MEAAKEAPNLGNAIGAALGGAALAGALMAGLGLVMVLLFAWRSRAVQASPLVTL